MIRPEELAPLLATIRATIADVLKPDLASDQTRSVADAALMSLDRIVTVVGSGENVAEHRLVDWQELRAQLASLVATATASQPKQAKGFLGNTQALLGEIDSMQQQLDEPAGLNALVDRLKAGDADARQWFASTVDALCDAHDAGEPVLPKASTRLQAADTAGEVQRLRDGLNLYLHTRFPELPAEPVTKLRLVPGGYSKQTAIFSIVANDVLPQNMVLRRDIPNAVTPSKVSDEYPFLMQAWEAGVRTPQPLLLEPEASHLGGSFMLMSEVSNAANSGTYFPEDRLREESRVGAEFGAEVAAALAYLHGRTRTSDTKTIPDYRKNALDSYAAWRKFGLKSPLSLSMELCYAWMLSHPLSADRPYCTTHGDFGIHNLLVRDGHLAAVVDWELAGIGDPAKDLAQCRMLLLPGIIEWDDFVREYIEAGGDPAACDAQSVAYFCVALFVEHCVNHLTLRQAFLNGERTDIGAAALITHYTDRSLQYQSRALQIAVDVERKKQ